MSYKNELKGNNDDLRAILETVNSLPEAGGGGIIPAGTMQITENGTYDVTSYATAEVNVPTGGGGGGGGGSEEEWIGDGNTHVWIRLEEGRTSPMLGVCPDGTVTVDWGDGTTPDTLTGTDTTVVAWTPTHNYAAPGDYVITVTVYGEMGFYGASSHKQGSGILRYSSSDDTRNYSYRNAVRKIEIGSGVTSIGIYAFQNCYSLTSIAIPDSVTSIGIYAFQNCYSLTSIAIPDSVTSIGNYAFASCYSLSSITIPDSVTSIGNYAFQNCYSLSSITIPDSVTSIGNNAFTSCYSLASIAIPDGVTSIGNYAFSGCYSLASIAIPDSVTSIGNYAFQNCYSLTSIAIPDGVTSIVNNAFSNCFSLTSVAIPDSVTSIGSNAFQQCLSLASINIPDSMTSIGSNTFRYCYSLAKIRFESTTPPTVAGSSSFSDIPADCIISVPVGSLAAYMAATNYPSASTYTYVEE